MKISLLLTKGVIRIREATRPATLFASIGEVFCAYAFQWFPGVIEVMRQCRSLARANEISHSILS